MFGIHMCAYMHVYSFKYMQVCLHCMYMCKSEAYFILLLLFYTKNYKILSSIEKILESINIVIIV